LKVRIEIHRRSCAYSQMHDPASYGDDTADTAFIGTQISAVLSQPLEASAVQSAEDYNLGLVIIGSNSAGNPQTLRCWSCSPDDPLMLKLCTQRQTAAEPDCILDPDFS
jgi:hypothetical protein